MAARLSASGPARVSGSKQMKPETWVSIYAAIIGTSAFFLNFKAWFDSGVKLSIALIPDGVVAGGDPRFDDRDIVIVTVTNRGDAPTMITTLVLFEFPTWWARLRRRSKNSYLIPRPELKGYPPSLPFELAPAKTWHGRLLKSQNNIGDLETGKFWVGIYASHRVRPYVKLIPKKKDRLPKATKELDT
jgi:hypothetical protein